MNNIDIKYIKGVGEKRAERFRTLGLTDVNTLLQFYPRGYEDWSCPVDIYDAVCEQNCCIKAKVISPVEEHRVRSNMILYKTLVSDNTGVLEVVFYNSKYTAQRLVVGEKYLFFGKISGIGSHRQISSPKIAACESAVIRPIYRTVAGLPSSVIEKTVAQVIDRVDFEDFLPSHIIEDNRLCDINFAVKNIHFPKDVESVEVSRRRLAFDELFLVTAAMKFKRFHNLKKQGIQLKKDYIGEFVKRLPFTLTAQQQKAIGECTQDMTSGRLMNRLLQGDVGSGKTVVGAALLYNAVRNGYQGALMVPTEILAEQHYENLSKFFVGTGINLALLTGSVTKSNKNKIKQALLDGQVDILIGTHALIEDDVVFKNLAIVITDEQHRFGVAQRTSLAKKQDNVHMLVMSATPIPRTMSLIIYGDLDISTINTLPKGRQPIETYCVTNNYRQRVYSYIKKHLDAGRQAYIVCPLVEKTESDLISAEEHAQNLSSGEFKDYCVGLIHGKMKSTQKDRVMREFLNGKIQLLISTTVIEVGIDVKNAVIMVIENAERFGLSQLHQLRGRIGRGEYKSTCILITDTKNSETKKRLDVICGTTDGFKIADEDLKLRGPGDFCGGRQHGLPEFKVADLVNDLELFRLAAKAADRVISSDSQLKKPENNLLRRKIIAFLRQTAKYGQN
ncbi:MAG: ATP-dependent DNA helicase RecG [bacterium]|nr:ATP-dependent DNA helicase RecG [bacterium]